MITFFVYEEKIRNSNTTGISSDFRYCQFNQGLSLDIFPIDNCHLQLVEENYAKVNNLYKKKRL